MRRKKWVKISAETGFVPVLKQPLEQCVGKKLFIKGIDVRDYFFECLVLSLVKPEKL
jgi:hypothetical protein